MTGSRIEKVAVFFCWLMLFWLAITAAPARAATIVYQDDFEAGIGGWAPSNGVWDVGTPSVVGPSACHQGTQCAATVLNGNAPATDSRLESPRPITLPTVTGNEMLLLRGWHWFQFGGLGYVQVRVYDQAGATWPTTWQKVSGDFTGNGAVWSPFEVDLTAFSGQKIQLGFFFDAGGGTPGWYLDEIQVIKTVPAFTGDFEGGWGDWSASNGLWEVGTPGAPGPASCYAGSQCVGTVLKGLAPATDSRLVSPAITLPTVSGGDAVTLRARHWFSFSGSQGSIQVSAFDPATATWSAWQTVGGPYTGTSTIWSVLQVDLTAFSGRRIRLGFLNDYTGVFGESAVGWYLDEIRIITSVLQFSGDFEGGWGDWAASNGVWDVGTPSVVGPSACHQGTQCAATILNGNAPGTDSRLQSPYPVTLPTVTGNEMLLLRGWHWFQFGGLGYVQVRVYDQAGATWPTTWQKVSGDFTGNGAVWSPFEVDLTAFSGQKIQLGFYFDAGGGTPGWYLDELQVIKTVPAFTGDFEGGWGDWSASNGLWEVGTPGAPGPTSCYAGAQCVGTVLKGSAPATDSRLVSPAITLPTVSGGEAVTLRARHWFSFSGSQGSIQVSAFDPATATWSAWQTVGGPYTGTSTIWSALQVDLTAFSGRRIRLGFLNDYTGVFGESAVGWYLDEMSINPPIGNERVISLSGDLNFGDVTLGQSAQRSMRISNLGTGILTVSAISYPAGFSGDWSSGSIAGGGYKDVTLTFTPTAAQGYGGNVVVSSDATSGTSTLAVSGTGVSTATRLINLSGDLNFGDVLLGQSAQRTLTIGNTGTGALSVTGISYPSGFSGNWSSGSIPAGGAQNVTVTFTPTAKQSYGGTLSVSSNATGGSNTLAIAGTGIDVTRLITLSGDLNFGNVTVGQSAQRTLTIGNTGTGALSVTGISYPSGFNGNWSSGSIPAGGAQNVTVTFTPTVAQAYSGTLSVSSNATSGTGSRAVSGVGIAPPDQIIATHSAPPRYLPGGKLVVTGQLSDGTGNTPLSLVWRPNLPAGWSITAVSGDGTPQLGGGNTEILFTAGLALPIDFTYEITVPAGANGVQTIGGAVEYMNSSMVNPLSLRAQPDPLTVQQGSYHSADYRDAFWTIDATEVSRVLAYWRAAAYHLDAAGADGYAPNTGNTAGIRHSADYQQNAWQIDTTEANRVMAYWRAGCYKIDAAGVDGYSPCSATPSSAVATGLSQVAAPVASHSAGPYTAGTLLTVNNSLIPPAEGALLSLAWRPSLPDGWSLSSVSGEGTPELSPDRTTILFSGSLTANPLQFTYQVSIPAGTCGSQAISAAFDYQTAGMANPASLKVTPDPLPISSAMGDNLLLPAETVTGTKTYTASSTITAGPNFRVSPTGKLTLIAGDQIRLQPGFGVDLGGQLSARIETTCGGATQAMEPEDMLNQPLAGIAPTEVIDGPVLIPAIDQLADGVREWLLAFGVDLALIDQSVQDTAGQWLVFETTQDILPEDRNGLSDIYRLDLFAESLRLVSRTPQGHAGNGPSRYPAATTRGDWVLFQSDAADLVPNDDNGVTDIFLSDTWLGDLRRITAGVVQASAHPALDATGTDLFYDQQDDAGYRLILADTPWGDTPTEPLSFSQDERGLALDNHHPAISADGRYLAYLEEGMAGEVTSCQVHFLDRDSQDYRRVPCPDDLRAVTEVARPAFSPDATELDWYIPNQDLQVPMANPLLRKPGNMH